jgi:hypothetical protein
MAVASPIAEAIPPHALPSSRDAQHRVPRPPRVTIDMSVQHGMTVSCAFAWHGEVLQASRRGRGHFLPNGRFWMGGSFTGHERLVLTAGGWLQQPPVYELLDLDGTFSADQRTYSGVVVGSAECTGFFGKRRARLTGDAAAPRPISATIDQVHPPSSLA